MSVKKKKESKLELEDKLHEICIADIGEEYRVLFKNDDGGEHVCVAFEEKLPPSAREYISSPFLGWRLMFVICPKGYLEVFHPILKINDYQR